MSDLRAIHVQTVVQTVLGLIDESGDVVHRQPVQLEINSLTPEAFEACCEKLRNLRDNLQQYPAEES